MCARAHTRVCVCSRRQDSGGAANVGALCRLVNARRDVTGHARLTKWTSFAKSALPPKYIFPRPFRACTISCACRRVFFLRFVILLTSRSPIPRRRHYYHNRHHRYNNIILYQLNYCLRRRNNSPRLF